MLSKLEALIDFSDEELPTELEQLFNYKLETFEVEDIKESKNRILKSRLRRAKSIPEVNLYAIMIIQDKLENDKETE